MSQAKQKMAELAKTQPLIHPGVFAITFREYDYAPPRHLRDIYGRVWRAFSDEHPRAPKKLTELKPREHGKSEAGTVDIATWRAMSDPTSRTLIMSEGSRLAEDKLQQCRTLIERHGDRFGLDIIESNNSSFTLANDANHGESTIEAAGFGSKVTGGHFDLIIFDDLVDWPSQRTEARREKIEKQFQNYINLGSEGESVYLVLGTRKHPEDLYNRLIENPAWYTTVDSAIQDWTIVENNEFDVVLQNPDTGDSRTIAAEDIHTVGQDEVIVDTVPHRDVEVLWPERWPLNKLLTDMLAGFGAAEGNLIWKRENQNDAEALQGQVLSEDMLSWIPHEEFATKSGLRWYSGLDPAVEDDPEKAATNDTDFWAFSALAHDGDTVYLMKPKRRRGMSLDSGISWLRARLNEYEDLNRTRVEKNQAQRWFVQTAKDRGINVVGTNTSNSKEERIISMSSRFESGKVVLVGDPTQWSSFVNEWCSFPTGSHDDMLDSVEIGLRGVGRQEITNTREIGDLPL